MPRVALNGIDLYYEQSGAGPRLLYFNGSGATVARTRVMVEPYAAHFDLVVHDQRGLGESSVPPGPYTMADYAADGAALMDHLGWERCRVVGVSFGGMVAQEFAVTWPERVERLALVCTSPGGDHASYPLHKLAGLDTDERQAAMLGLLDTRFTPDWLAAHEGDRRLVEGLSSMGSVTKSDEQLRGEREQLLARSHHDVNDRLHRVTSPTLVASGRYDGIAPLENGEAIAARIPGAELRAYEGGHVFMAQDPRAHFEIIEFLGRA
jgi:pimeloyl-ACP methyl ester carboxylesterase